LILDTTFQGNFNFDANTKDTQFLMSTILVIFDPYIELYNINVDEFIQLIYGFQLQYNSNQNPYHNFFHGVNVLFASNYSIT
jgi:hypothetical protein